MADLLLTWLRRGEYREGSVPLLKAECLCVRVGIRRVLEDVNLEVYKGDALCVTGPNGSGKSTLLNAVAGLEPARIESGKVIFLGKDVTSQPPHERARLGLGYLRQRDNIFPDLTVKENLRLALGPDGHGRFEETYPRWAVDLPPRKRGSLLSGGQCQRLAWAMATLRPCLLLLADEPEAGLSEQIGLPVTGTFVVASHSLERWQGDVA